MINRLARDVSAIIRVFVVITAACLVRVYCAAASPTYYPVDLGPIGATAMNNSGTIVYSAVVDGKLHGYTYSAGIITDLGVVWSVAGINNSGVVVCNIVLPSGAIHAATYSNGTFSDLGTLGGATSFALGISDTGLVVGLADTVFSQQPFIYANGKMSVGPAWPNLPNITSITPKAINSAGQAAGEINARGSFAFFLTEQRGRRSPPEPATPGWSPSTAQGGSWAMKIQGPAPPIAPFSIPMGRSPTSVSCRARCNRLPRGSMPPAKSSAAALPPICRSRAHFLTSTDR